MTRCKLHFKDDPTAHATVEWFLSQLSPNNKEQESSLSNPDNSSHSFAQSFVESLIKEESPLSEALCKGLTAARFIDCLRKQVAADKDLFKRIESIAEELKNTGEWNTFPNLCCLLLSTARKSLKDRFPGDKQSVRETSLYCVVKQIYNSLKEKDVLNEGEVSLALEAGIQLSHFQETPWQQAFTEFKILHYKELDALRQYYFSANDPSTFSRRVVERYQWNISGLRECENPEFNKLIKNFEVFNPDLDFLHPMCLQLPILAQNVEAIKIARDDEQDKDFCEKLANKFRILQWDIFCRDIIEEDRTGEVAFYPITNMRNIPGIPDTEFLTERVVEIRSVECCFSPPLGGERGEIPIDPRACSGPAGEIPTEVGIGHYRKAFENLLPHTAKLHKSAHEDCIRSFANNGKNVVLIEDGEFSFFSLLWLLRRATRKGVQLGNWLSGNDEGAVRYCPIKDIDDRCSPYDFAEECGLIIRLSDPDRCVSTTRWQSLIAWLRRQNHNLRNKYKEKERCYRGIKKIKHDDDLLKQVPVKTLDYNEQETSFIKNMWKFFSTSNLETILDELDKTSPDASMTCEAFVKNRLEPLVTSLENASLLQVESSDHPQVALPNNLNEPQDMVLLRCCRAVFIPLEHLFRAYWPCELHLLIQPLNWEESNVRNLGRSPVSLGFATIAGRVALEPDSIVGLVEMGKNSKEDSGDLQKPMTDFEYWLAPYHSLFSVLNSNTAQYVIKDIGSHKQRRYFVHQTAGLLGMVWNDLNRDKLEHRNKFALWLATTQAIEIWGSIPLDTTLKASVDFPTWKNLNERQIVDKLVDLGLSGGHLRASRPPKTGGLKNEEWDLTNYMEQLPVKNPNLSDHDKLISHVRCSLSFHSPEDTNPPDWVMTKAFAICFYHGLWQAAYHALKTFVLIDDKKVQKEKPCLWIEWDKQSVSIYNRGKVKKEYHEPTDREFFNLFLQKTDAFCYENEIDEVFKIDGPEPADIPDTWQLVIRKEKQGVQS